MQQQHLCCCSGPVLTWTEIAALQCSTSTPPPDMCTERCAHHSTAHHGTSPTATSRLDPTWMYICYRSCCPHFPHPTTNSNADTGGCFRYLLSYILQGLHTPHSAQGGSRATPLCSTAQHKLSFVQRYRRAHRAALLQRLTTNITVCDIMLRSSHL